jgi:hypothetical protein
MSVDDATTQLHQERLVPMPSRDRRPSAALDMSLGTVNGSSAPGVPVLASHQQRPRPYRDDVLSQGGPTRARLVLKSRRSSKSYICFCIVMAKARVSRRRYRRTVAYAATSGVSDATDE